MQRSILCHATALALASLLTGSTRGAELKPDTVAAFNRYIQATEGRIARDVQNGRFLIIDDLPDKDRREAYIELRQGEIYIQHLLAEEDEAPIKITHGLIHHWAGIVFIPEVTLAETLAELQDYADQPSHYFPAVRQARILEQNGKEFKNYRQLYRKQLVTVVINAEFDDVYDTLNTSEATIRSYSTRLAEVAEWNQPDEHELPLGNDHGYVWRYYSYAHIEEKEGGVYLQVEVVTLSRTVPVAFTWLVNPLIRSVPRHVLTEQLTETRQAVLKRKEP